MKTSTGIFFMSETRIFHTQTSQFWISETPPSFSISEILVLQIKNSTFSYQKFDFSTSKSVILDIWKSLWPRRAPCRPIKYSAVRRRPSPYNTLAPREKPTYRSSSDQKGFGTAFLSLNVIEKQTTSGFSKFFHSDETWLFIGPKSTWNDRKWKFNTVQGSWIYVSLSRPFLETSSFRFSRFLGNSPSRRCNTRVVKWM